MKYVSLNISGQMAHSCYTLADPLYMAGLYDIREGRPCYCILTTEANRSMEEVHPRMPLILGREHLRDWLEKPKQAEEFLHSVPPELEKQPMERQLSFW